MEKQDYHFFHCIKCGAINRIPDKGVSGAAKCGKCGAELKVGETGKTAGGYYFFRCPECRSRNKIPDNRIDSGPKCGKCGKPLDTGALFIPQPLTISEANFDREVLGSPLPVLLMFWAAWCPKCRAAMPAIDEFAKDAKGKVRVGKVDVEANPALASKYNILGVPQLLIFDNGRLQETIPGAIQKHEMMMKMAHYI